MRRIRATACIDAHGVKPGDLGGYIESPENLDGNAWVSGNALVCDDRLSLSPKTAPALTPKARTHVLAFFLGLPEFWRDGAQPYFLARYYAQTLLERPDCCHTCIKSLALSRSARYNNA